MFHVAAWMWVLLVLLVLLIVLLGYALLLNHCQAGDLHRTCHQAAGSRPGSVVHDGMQRLIRPLACFTVQAVPSVVVPQQQRPPLTFSLMQHTAWP